MKSPVILRVFKNSQLVEVKQFDSDQIVIGHNADVQLDLEGDGVSAIHCLIERRDTGYFLCDLGSEGGTYKNGQAVLDEALNSGDEILVGPYKIVFFVGVPKPKTVPVPPATSESTVIVPPPAAPVSEVQATLPQAPPAPADVKSEPPSAPVEKSQPEIPAAEAKPQPPPSIPERPVIPDESSIVVAPVPESPKITTPPVRPEVKSRSASQPVKRKRGPTFAPASNVKDLKQVLKPGKGNTVEVIVAWRERIIETYNFRTRGNFRVGTTDRDAIRVASAEIPRNWVLLGIGKSVEINVSDAMSFELISSQGRKSLDEAVASGKGSRAGAGTKIRLDQGEMVCLTVGGGNINIFIRYAPLAPVVPLLPPLGLSGSEMSGLVMALVLTALLAFYVSATTPKDLFEEKQDDVTMTAQIIFNKPPPRETPPPPPPPPPPEENPPPPPPPPKKAEVAEVKREQQKKGQQQNKTAQKAETAGRAAEVAPIPNSQNRPKKFTSTKQGGAVKLGEKAGANANSAKDVSKVGLFSAFGGGGVRSKLDQAYSGAGELLGQADKATGASGFSEDRAGDDLGSKFKDTGAGGKGTATQGIAGIGTKGKGSGQGTYGSVGGLGARNAVVVESGGAEEDFVGTIDREAVRRRIRHYLHEVRGCYNRELNKLEKGERLEGKIVFVWEIVAQGVARNVRVKSSTLNNANVENCIRQRLASWSFPEPPVGLTAEVSFPFYLRPEN